MASITSGTVPFVPPATIWARLGQDPLMRWPTTAPNPSAATQLSPASSATSDLRRSSVVTSTVRIHSTKVMMPSHQRMSSHDGTASISPMTAFSNPDWGTATNDRSRIDTTVPANVTTSVALRSLGARRPELKNGTPLRAPLTARLRV